MSSAMLSIGINFEALVYNPRPREVIGSNPFSESRETGAE